jgi:hypothetical protein
LPRSKTPPGYVPLLWRKAKALGPILPPSDIFPEKISNFGFGLRFELAAPILSLSDWPYGEFDFAVFPFFVGCGAWGVPAAKTDDVVVVGCIEFVIEGRVVPEPALVATFVHWRDLLGKFQFLVLLFDVTDALRPDAISFGGGFGWLASGASG